jgi:hypothetical protein
MLPPRKLAMPKAKKPRSESHRDPIENNIRAVMCVVDE